MTNPTLEAVSEERLREMLAECERPATGDCSCGRGGDWGHEFGCPEAAPVDADPDTMRSILTELLALRSSGGVKVKGLLDLALKELDALDAKTVPQQIRNALSSIEPAEQEPVGYVRPETLAKLREGDAGPIVGVAAFDTTIPLYASPASPEAGKVTVTDEMVERGARAIAAWDLGYGDPPGVIKATVDARWSEYAEQSRRVLTAALTSEQSNG